mmetsp:Transcript_9869/g.20954  ORF Transcript_9869/g.20954 Transcript_9869/m.20954 type:complete len:89 (+) Transcript_9869:827-1093(+)
MTPATENLASGAKDFSMHKGNNTKVVIAKITKSRLARIAGKPIGCKIREMQSPKIIEKEMQPTPALAKHAISGNHLVPGDTVLLQAPP